MAKKIDYSFKAEVLNSDLPKLVNQIERAIYAHEALIFDGVVVNSSLDFETAIELRSFLIQEHGEKKYHEAEKLINARLKRVSRLRKRIDSFLESFDCVFFLTLTFDDKTLETTSFDTRRRYIRRCLASISDNFVANVDYGAKNHREHYHAVFACNFTDEEYFSCPWFPRSGLQEQIFPWQYGFYKLQPVLLFGNFCRKSSVKNVEAFSETEIELLLLGENSKRLSKYVSKLTNHAIKETASAVRCIYSRAKHQ